MERDTHVPNVRLSRWLTFFIAALSSPAFLAFFSENLGILGLKSDGTTALMNL